MKRVTTFISAAVMAVFLCSPVWAECKTPDDTRENLMEASGEFYIDRMIHDEDVQIWLEGATELYGYPPMDADLLEAYKNPSLIHVLVILYKDGCYLGHAFVSPERFGTIEQLYRSRAEPEA